HQEPAVPEIATQGGDLLFAEPQTARLDNINEWVVEQFLVGQTQHLALRVHLEGGHLQKPEAKIQFCVRIIGHPPPSASPSIRVIVIATGRRVLDANESKN